MKVRRTTKARPRLQKQCSRAHFLLGSVGTPGQAKTAGRTFLSIAFQVLIGSHKLEKRPLVAQNAASLQG